MKSERADNISPRFSVVGGPVSWRTPAVILVCGCLIALLGFGARSGLGFFSHPDVECTWVGPRRVRARARHPDAAVGRGPARGRGGGRPLWSRAGPQPGGGPLCVRSGVHGLRDHAGHAPSHGRCGDRIRARRLLLHRRDRRIRPADAVALALGRLRRGDGGRLVRAIPVLSARGVWWLSILLGLLSAAINLPIVEKPVVRPTAVPA